MARTRYRIVERGRPHFLTFTVNNWLPVFTRPPTVQILFDSMAFLQRQGRWTLHGYVVLENHLHLIARAEDLSREIQSFKSYTAHELVAFLQKHRVTRLLRQLAFHKLPHLKDREHQVWQQGSHPVLIQNDAMMRQKLEYIHYNPVKRGYVDEPEHWRYSSARNYADQDGLLAVTTEW